MKSWKLIIGGGVVASILMLLPGGKSLLAPENALIWVFMGASFGLYLYGTKASYRQVTAVGVALTDAEALLAASEGPEGAKAADAWAAASGRAQVRGSLPWAWTLLRQRGHEAGDRAIGAVESGLHAAGSLVNGVAGAMVSVGLCGTMIGLILSLFTLKAGFDEIDGGAAKLMEHMVHAIGAMGLAFYATLFGAALGGVVLRFAHLHVTADIERLTSLWDAATADVPDAVHAPAPGTGDVKASDVVMGMLSQLEPGVRAEVEKAITGGKG